MKNKRINDFVKKNKIFITILLASFLIRFFLFFQHHEVWWDSGVYIGMGKHILSFGSAGLWEHIRPILWSLILGIGWKSGLEVIVFGRALTLLFSAGSIFIFYLITLRIFNKKTALIASAMFSFSTIFFYLGFHLYTEIPAMFFLLAGIYLFIENRVYFSGLFFGLAFLTKFPAPILLISVLLVLLWKKEARKSFFLLLGFATPVIPFFIANQIAYSNFLTPLISARETIVNVLGCNVLRYKPFYYYFYIALFDNPLNIFAVLGIFYFFKKYEKKKLLAFLCLLLPLIYFSQLHCRDYRYFALFVPFVIMFSASGISLLVKKKKHLMPVLLAVLVFSAVFSLHFYFSNEQKEIPEADGYFRFLEGKETKLEVWSSNPVVSAYTKLKINKIYYPIYGAEVSSSFYSYLLNNSQKIGYVFMDSCGGGIICHPEDMECAKKLNMTYSYLDKNFNIVYDKTRGRCTYKIYKS